jgi:hypothetical protein
VLPVRTRARPSKGRDPTPDPEDEIASGELVVVASGAVPRRLRSLLMEITCAGCGCVVDRGVIITRCDTHPRCCCGELRLADELESP